MSRYTPCAPASHEHRRRDEFPTCSSLLPRQFQREQLLVSSSPSSASSARGTGTSLDGTQSGCSAPMDSGTRLIVIAPPLAAVAGEESKLPLLPRHRTTAATHRAPGKEDALEMLPAPPIWIWTAQIGSNGL